MRKLDINEFKLCQIIGKIFEKSINLFNQSSPMFIRRFMTNESTKCFFDKTYLSSSNNDEDIIISLNYKCEEIKNKLLYNNNQMYWIGYIYGALSFLYNLSSKTIYKLFPAKQIVKYYCIYHTFDIEEASERMMENIGYKEKNAIKDGVMIFKRIILLDKLKSLIGQTTHVYIDRPIGSVHPNNSKIVYSVNYGYIKELIALDGEYQDAYVIGVNDTIKEFDGVISAIVNRVNDIEDKLIVIPKDRSYSKQEIEKAIQFQEKYYKHKIIIK